MPVSGTAASLIAAGVAAAGAGATYMQTEKVQHEREQAEAQSILHQQEIQRQGDQRVNATVQKIAASSPDQDRIARMDEYMRRLTAARHARGDNGPDIGGAAFDADQAASDAVTAQKGAQTASLLSAMDAPIVQRRNEAFDYGRLGTALDLLKSRSQGQSFVDRLRAASIHGNPMVGLAAGLANAYGSNYMPAKTSPTLTSSTLPYET